MTKYQEIETKLKEFEKPKREEIRGIIYKYENLINQKNYIGQTTNEQQRRNKFISQNNYSGELINKAKQKYGVQNFKYDIIFRSHYLNFEDSIIGLDLMEIYYIDKYNSYRNGYNLTKGGSGARGYKPSEETLKLRSEKLKGENNGMFGKHHTKEAKEKMSQKLSGRGNANYGKTGEKHFMYGKHHSEETKKKISDSNRGKNCSEETKKKIGEANKGRKRSEETKRKLSLKFSGSNNPNFGKQRSEETKNKIKQSLKGRKLSEETKKKLSIAHKGIKLSEESINKIIQKNIVSIIQLEMNGEFIRKWDSIKEASRELNISDGHICSCCKGKRKSSGGYKWKYAEEQIN